ncbi:MAG TPA: hypothetical protein VF297_17315 [Pyrinomonadaceae bacterium]
MSRINRRAFYHRVMRTPKGPPPAASAGGERTRKFYYERLTQVSIRHTYYNAARDECPDFDIWPTPMTETLMSALGLLYRYEKTGFSVLYDVLRKDVLLNYLARQQKPDGPLSSAGECWARLSFVCALNNPYFINFTSMPIDANPAEENFYFTNRKAHEEDNHVLLNLGGHVTGDELLDVVPRQVQIHLRRGVEAVLVRDLSGEVVIEPECCPPVADAPPGGWDDTCVVYLDLSALPEGKYKIQVVEGIDCEDARRSGSVIREWRVLYTTPFPVPLCFVDLLFTDPKGDGRGIYPVLYPEVDGEGVIVPVHYELRFRARATYWNYFIVPQAQAETFEGLRIESVMPSAVEFAGPCCVTLANGARAYRFSSVEQLRLQQLSEYNFRLCGRHGLMTHDEVLVGRLPVASPKQVLPLSAEAACAALNERLCPGEEPDGRCRRLIDFVCTPGGPGPPGGDGPAARNYSDTYVYV